MKTPELKIDCAIDYKKDGTPVVSTLGISAEGPTVELAVRALHSKLIQLVQLGKVTLVKQNMLNEMAWTDTDNNIQIEL